MSETAPLADAALADAAASDICAKLPRALGISLARRPARQKAFVARAAEARVPLELCDAVDGRAMDRLPAGVALYRGWCLAGHANRFFSRELKWGEVGCGLSHAAAWADIAASDAPVAVLEDDAEFAPGFADLVRAALREVAALEAAGEIAPPDLLYLGRRAMAPAADRLLPRAAAVGGSSAPAPPASPRLVVPAFSYKTTAYVLWPRGAAKLLRARYLDRLVPVDELLPTLYCRRADAPGLARDDLDALYADAPRLAALAVRPSLVWERRGLSDTEASGEVNCK